MCFISALLCLLTTQAQSQQTDSKTSAAMLAPIINLLLEELPPIERPNANESISLGLNDRNDPVRDLGTNDSLLIEFEKQRTSVELCFDIRRIANNNNGLIVELNGKPIRVLANDENCIVITASQQRSINYLLIRTTSRSVRLARFELGSTNPTDSLGFPTVSRGQWDEDAVRKVLKVFAYGGHATDSQIRAWAHNRPASAIREMLNFDQFNPRLSPQVPDEPYDQLTSLSQGGTLRGFTDHISSDSSNLPFPTFGRVRENFTDSPIFQSFPERWDTVFGKMASIRGLNPFRQKIGLWETNYHMVANIDAGVSQSQIVSYYDDIMNEHAKPNVPYHQVIGVAAKSAAIAMQYGHRLNQWIENRGECRCNDDFAREIHQLFYGIFGENDPNHEDGTIRETAKMLTDMPINRFRYTRPRDNRNFDAFEDTVSFGTSRHHVPDLVILGQTVSGANAAAKIDSLMPISMQHQESLENLPIMIVQGLADDNLSEGKKRTIRTVWRNMGVNRNFLSFIRGYALSRLFHNPTQFKHATSLDRAIYQANRYNTSNLEAYYGGTRFFKADFNNQNTRNVEQIGVNILDIIRRDNAGDVFEPINNVFGAQSSAEAANSSLAFSENYNRSANSNEFGYLDNFANRCNDCDAGSRWVKDWTNVIPPQNGNYRVEYVARWLWQHITGGLTGYTAVEEAHLSSLLGAVSPVSEDFGQENPTASNFQTPLVWDINNLLCIRADRLSRNESASSLNDLVNNRDVIRRCNSDSNGRYSTVEQAALDLAITTTNIQNIGYLRNLVNELKAQNLELNPTNTVAARRANARINAAVSFIFATPYVFATGGQ